MTSDLLKGVIAQVNFTPGDSQKHDTKNLPLVADNRAHSTTGAARVKQQFYGRGNI